jgi:hypothetical protein
MESSDAGFRDLRTATSAEMQAAAAAANAAAAAASSRQSHHFAIPLPRNHRHIPTDEHASGGGWPSAPSGDWSGDPTNELQWQQTWPADAHAYDQKAVEDTQAQLLVMQAMLQYQARQYQERSEQVVRSSETLARMQTYVGTMEAERARAVHTAQQLARDVSTLRGHLATHEPQKLARLSTNLSEIATGDCDLASLAGVGPLFGGAAHHSSATAHDPAESDAMPPGASREGGLRRPPPGAHREGGGMSAYQYEHVLQGTLGYPNQSCAAVPDRDGGNGAGSGSGSSPAENTSGTCSASGTASASLHSSSDPGQDTSSGNEREGGLNNDHSSSDSADAASASTYPRHIARGKTDRERQGSAPHRRFSAQQRLADSAQERRGSCGDVRGLMGELSPLNPSSQGVLSGPSSDLAAQPLQQLTPEEMAQCGASQGGVLQGVLPFPGQGILNLQQGVLSERHQPLEMLQQGVIRGSVGPHVPSSAPQQPSRQLPPAPQPPSRAPTRAAAETSGRAEGEPPAKRPATASRQDANNSDLALAGGGSAGTVVADASTNDAMDVTA